PSTSPWRPCRAMCWKRSPTGNRAALTSAGHPPFIRRMRDLRGYFGIGVEAISKPMNLGALQRTAHAFGAAFTFSVDAAPAIREMHNSDTAKSDVHVPWYLWKSVDDMQLPKGCTLVGVELTDDAVDLPSFKHPLRAAYVMGGERRDLSKEMQARCSHIVK